MFLIRPALRPARDPTRNETDDPQEHVLSQYAVDIVVGVAHRRPAR